VEREKKQLRVLKRDAERMLYSSKVEIRRNCPIKERLYKGGPKKNNSGAN